MKTFQKIFGWNTLLSNFKDWQVQQNSYLEISIIKFILFLTNWFDFPTTYLVGEFLLTIVSLNSEIS